MPIELGLDLGGFLQNALDVVVSSFLPKMLGLYAVHWVLQKSLGFVNVSMGENK